MAVSFKVKERKVMINGQPAKIRYAQTLKTGDMDLSEICDLTSKISAVSEGDVRSIINTVTDSSKDGLSRWENWVASGSVSAPKPPKKERNLPWKISAEHGCSFCPVGIFAAPVGKFV